MHPTHFHPALPTPGLARRMKLSARARWRAVLRHRAISSVVALAMVTSGAAMAWTAAGGPFERFEPLELASPGQMVRLPTQGDAPAADLDPLDDKVRTYLLMGVGVAGMDERDQRRLGLGDAGKRGEDRLTDVLMVVLTHQASGQATTLSIPRDTWLDWRRARINATYPQHGTQALIDDVQRLTGIPIHHAVRINFQGFADVVDALGGVDIATDRPLRDRDAKLLLPEAGCYELDGKTALAYVRSRKTQSLTGGSWRPDVESSDFGRIAKQQRVMAAIVDTLAGPQAITAVPGLYRAAGDNVVMDRNLDLRALTTLARAFQSVSSGAVDQHTLPANVGRVGAASVVLVDHTTADPLLAELAAWPVPPETTSEQRPARTAPEPPAASGPDEVDSEDASGPAGGSATHTCADGEPRLSPPDDLSELARATTPRSASPARSTPTAPRSPAVTTPRPSATQPHRAPTGSTTEDGPPKVDPPAAEPPSEKAKSKPAPSDQGTPPPVGGGGGGGGGAPDADPAPAPPAPAPAPPTPAPAPAPDPAPPAGDSPSAP